MFFLACHAKYDDALVFIIFLSNEFVIHCLEIIVLLKNMFVDENYIQYNTMMVVDGHPKGDPARVNLFNEVLF